MTSKDDKQKLFSSSPAPIFRQSLGVSLFLKVVLLIAIVGLVVSILGSLRCDFLGRRQLEPGRSSTSLYRGQLDNIFRYNYDNQVGESKTQSNIIVGYTWLGIFTYQSEDSVEEDTVTYPQCMQHTYTFGNAPYKTLVAAQACSIMAPFFCIVSLVLLFVSLEGFCWHQYSRMLSTTGCALLTVAFLVQEVPLVLFLDPQLCGNNVHQGYPCVFGPGAWFIVASGLCFFSAVSLLLLYFWVDNRYDGQLMPTSRLTQGGNCKLGTTEFGTDSITDVGSDEETVRPGKTSLISDRIVPKENLILMHMQRNLVQKSSMSQSLSISEETGKKDWEGQLESLTSTCRTDHSLVLDYACDPFSQRILEQRDNNGECNNSGEQ
ncbi:hypothetical protein IV203_018808 [Nitzschia inconspicua]|uniref:Uncharacterized protein n=1 Tax=Nitzschia inconspicua TaxID=303405 RepID=A0A9K3M2B4_9STRA|nr:hypothetical protein IV203_018808 [Nitzschia inconspicua]